MSSPGLEMSTRVHVGEVMNVPIVTAPTTTRADRLARIMRTKKIGSVIITARGQPVGIVTEGDLARRVVARNVRPSRLTASQVMSKPLTSIPEKTQVMEAARLMRKLRVKRLPVVRDGRLVGIVSVSDLSAVAPDLLEVLSEKSRIRTGETIRGRPYYDGYCDNCERWSDNLLEIDGRFLCEECRGEEIPARVP
jgi:CBS domain-containing protein